MNPNEKEEYVLQLKNIHKTFGKNHVLKGINLNLRKGSVIGLMGENGAGKSTLMKILFGIYSKDEGNVTLEGQSVQFAGPKDALENGVAMVHQELNQCLNRNVLDNLFLGRFPGSAFYVDEKMMEQKARALFKELGISVDLKSPMKTMSVAKRQMVEIAKAVSYNAKVIVLDEPTSSLTEVEVKKLFTIVNNLRKTGTSFVYISHKMDEIFEICDDVAVMRDGQMIMSKSVKETNMNEIISAMVGRSLDQRFPPVDNVPGDTILKIENLCTMYAPYLKNISLNIKKGEIFGLYGLVGAGRSELLETLFGLRTIKSGKIYYKDSLMLFKNSQDAINAGFAFVTEERKFNGLFLKSTIEFNTAIAAMKKYVKGISISNDDMLKSTKKEIEVMHTKCMSPHDPITALSGGNQQKVVIGRWLELSPDVFLLDEPTRGIDVGAKYQIYELIISLAKQGKTCIVVSSEMPEILGITNRIGVMSNGHLSGIVNTKETNQEELMRLSAMYL